MSAISLLTLMNFEVNNLQVSQILKEIFVHKNVNLVCINHGKAMHA